MRGCVSTRPPFVKYPRISTIAHLAGALYFVAINYLKTFYENKKTGQALRCLHRVLRFRPAVDWFSVGVLP